MKTACLLLAVAGILAHPVGPREALLSPEKFPNGREKPDEPFVYYFPEADPEWGELIDLKMVPPTGKHFRLTFRDENGVIRHCVYIIEDDRLCRKGSPRFLGMYIWGGDPEAEPPEIPVKEK